MSKSLEELKSAVIRRAEEEARRIIESARKEAEDILRRAEEERKRMIEEARKKMFKEIGYEQRIAEAKLRARTIISEAKNKIVLDLRDRIIGLLNNMDDARRIASIRNLLQESINIIGIGEGRRIIVRVSRRDLGLVNMIIREFSRRYRIDIHLEPADILGGVIVEDPESGVSIDNSYDTKLKRILSLSAPEIHRRLFT